MAEDKNDSTALARYEFRRKLEQVQSIEGKATELVSLYVPPSRQISDVSNYLRGEYAQSSNIKSQSTRKNVMAAIASILNRIKVYRVPPENGVVLFVGTEALPGNKEKSVTIVIEPPEPIGTFLYRCDSKFYLEPLEAMLAEKEVWGLVVMDRKEATIGRLNGKRIEVVDSFESQVPSKHRMGGQSSRRFERLIEDAADKFFIKIGERINSAFLGDHRLQGIIIGGPGSTKNVITEHEYIHYELRGKVLGFFDVGYTDESGLKELVENAGDLLKDIGLMKEKKLVDRFMREVARPDGGLAAYGEREVREALNLGAVDTLLLSEGLRKYRYTARCPNQNCGFTGEVTQAEDEFRPAPCPRCGTELVSEEDPEDVVDQLYKAAEQVGTKVSLISADSNEGKTLLNAFGGMAAILRYRIK
ncbi:MAG: peptide chain release factor 1 [Euryarchaeota archaeon]|nr:peptide chain release factor 1 [Euryarchaeota archaeon]